MVLACAWLLSRAINWRGTTNRATRATALLFAWAILHIIVGRQGVFVHEWWWWPLTPAVAMASGLIVDRICEFLERRGPSVRVINGTIAVLLIAFATSNTMRAAVEIQSPKRISDDPALNYTLVELGEVIRAAAPPNEAVMLAESDQSMSLWYYADRPLKRQVWDPYTFEKRLTDGTSDLLFGLTERWDRQPVAFVFPKAYRSAKTEPLLTYLQARYPQRKQAKFFVFNLSASAAALTQKPSRLR
jgi:hypothetical protein